MNDSSSGPRTPVSPTAQGYDCTAPNIGEELGLSSDGLSGSPNAPAPIRLPAEFKPVGVYRCAVELTPTESLPKGGIVAEHLVGDLSALLQVLATPNSQDADGVSENGEELCAANMEIVPVLWLVDELDQAIRVQWPTNACGKSLTGSLEVLDALAATRVDVRGP
jgi:hypothetical protein